MDHRAATGLVFFTSALVLVIEILAGRLMAPYVGVSLEAFTGIIGTVLAGIATGAAVGGHLADSGKPRQLITTCLILGGTFTWLSVPIVAFVGPGMNNSPGSIIILTFVAFFAPTAFLSAISPMVAKLRLESLEETGVVMGNLSAAGTVGALLGTFGTGFILLGLLPIRTIIYGIGALLILGGLAARLLWKTDAATDRPDPRLLSVALVAGVLSVGTGSPCDYETDYTCARIIHDADRSGGRSLILDQVRHAHVDLDDPTHLELRYAKLLGAVIDSEPAGAIDVLHVGGGGFSIPRYVSATRPGSRNVVLELDEGLIAIAEAELGLADVENLEIRIGDARLKLPKLGDEEFDLIVGDAFGGDVVPWALTTREAVAEYARVLSPGGIYVLNLIDGGESKFARAQLATLAEHFQFVGVVLPPDRSPSLFNQIIVASDEPLAEIAIPPAIGELLTGQAVADYIGDSDILTDNFAPAEQLKNGG